MFRGAAVILFLSVFLLQPAGAQDVKIRGQFHLGTVDVGQTLPYSLTARYPSKFNLLLPDTTWSFAPFEIQSKKFFPTVTKNNISYDSVVYFLTTFEIDSIQTLHLPAFVVHSGDCTRVESNTDTVFLRQLVHFKLDSVEAKKLPLKINTDYQNVSWLLNYPLVIIIIGILLVVLIAVWIIFGKRIRRHYQLKRMTRKHADFVQQFSTSVAQLQGNFSAAAAESVFVLWKKYMEYLLSRPYTRYTSREIINLEKDETLSQALRAINRIIYAGINPSSEEAFVMLRNYTEEQFMNKTRELKNG